jgi:HEAT repeat protein
MSLAGEQLTDDESDSLHQHQLLFLSSNDPGVRSKATLYCANANYPQRSIDAIQPLLDDPIQRVRLNAVSGLRILGRYTLAPVEVLLNALKHSDPNVRMHASSALGSIAKYNQEPAGAFDALVSVYETDDSPRVRGQALQDLCDFSSQLPETQAHIRAAIRSPDAEVRAGAMWALSSIDTFDTQFEFEATLSAIQDQSADVRDPASWLLQNRIKSDALAPHLELLKSLASSEDEFVRKASRLHLLQMSEKVPEYHENPATDQATEGNVPFDQ